MTERALKILVVDDTEATRYAVSRILKREGFHTVEAETGTQALAMVLSERPDLVTLDIHLPDMLGFEVCRRIKANPLSADIPVLQVSASFVTSGDRIHGLEGGADSYLTHPFEPPVLIATVQSLLRGRRLTRQLRLAEEKFRVALKNAPIMIYTTDAQLRYTWICNPPAGLCAQDFLNKDDLNFLSIEEATSLRNHKTEVLRTGRGKRVTTGMTFGARKYVFDVTIEPLLTGVEVVGLTVACVDVTERLRAEDAQRIALVEAELANQAKTQFLANMSHEIRTPLGVIQGFTDLVLDEAATAEQRRGYLFTIKRNAQDLSVLLGDILDLAKIEAGRIEIENADFSLPALLRDVVEGLRITGGGRLEMTLEIDQSVPEVVHSDAGRVRQICVNLISNALKFTERGFVHVTARASGPTAADPGVRIAIRVEDTGIGLNPEQCTRLFQPFMQADSSTTRKFGGTGLGLNLSKKLAAALGGELRLIASEPGRGSAFEVTFDGAGGRGVDGAVVPECIAELTAGRVVERIAERVAERVAKCVAETVGDPITQGVPTDPVLNGMRVLLVEDSEDNQILFTHYLRGMGAAVELAVDGVDGLAMARASSYDAILMDIQMPNLDGHGVTKALRLDGNRVPIVALTAHALKEERDRALAHGFDGYLTKPLNPRSLVDVLSLYRPT